MADTKFTPGPWRVAHDHPDPLHAKGIAYIRPVEQRPYPYDDEIAVVYGTSHESHPHRAHNAHLVAAAPELYEALAQITDVYAAMREILSSKYPLEGWSAESMTLDRARNALAKSRGEQP